MCLSDHNGHVKTVFFDVDTQLDFLFPAGALAVPGAECIVPALAALTRFAAANNIQIIATADAHTENDLEFKIWKPHCVAGTFGQRKSAASSLPSPLVIPTSKQDEIGRSVQSHTSQIIVEKQSIDCFTNPNLGPLLTAIAADRYVVYGVATEHCVQNAFVGLLKAGAKVELVEDAICGIDAAEVRRTIAKFTAAGGNLTSSSAVTAS